MFEATKEFHWEGAHRLSKPYCGTCAHIHGHSFRLQVTVQCSQLDKVGFVVNFNEIKNLVEPLVKDLDHKLVLNEKDELVAFFGKKLPRSFKDIWRGMLFVPFNPTSENMAKWLFEKIEREALTKFSPAVSIKSVTFFETATCFATYSVQD